MYDLNCVRLTANSRSLSDTTAIFRVWRQLLGLRNMNCRAIEKKLPIGSKDRHREIREALTEKESNTDINIVYQSVDQLRDMELLLDLNNNPPQIYHSVSFKGIVKNADGLYKMSDVESRFEQALEGIRGLFS